MQIPAVTGLIERRMLVNYQVDPVILARILPAPFKPKLIHGVGIAGICLIRLNHIRPTFITANMGIGSENAAHRIAVEWIENGELHEGVFIPRRDTSSRVNTLVGGRLFPGEHHYAHFGVCEKADRYQIDLRSDDGQTTVSVAAKLAPSLPSTSVFRSLSEASTFFEAGSLGYSVTHQPGRYDGLELRSFNWKIEPLAVEQVNSSFFDNQALFPKGSIHFDCALLMRDIRHEWHGREGLAAVSLERRPN